MKKIINYLLYVCKNNDIVSSEEDCIIKVLDYLKDYLMENPIHFLKVIIIKLANKFRNNYKIP